MDSEDFLGSDDLVDQLDQEVKRVSDLFRFILKYKEQFQPSGIEFSDLRQYLASDDASRIDWKNSAKSQDLFVKEYEEEHDMDVFILVDASDSMFFGTADYIKAEYAAIIAGALAYASVDAGISVGFGLYAGDRALIMPNGGQAQYRRILMEATKHENYGGDFNLETSLKDVIERVKDNTALFIVSDFIGLEGEWKPPLHIASTKFRHVMCIMCRDLRDYKLPDAGMVRFESPDGSEQQIANTDRFREEFEETVAEQEEDIKQKCIGSGASFIKIDTRDEFSGRFAEYFDEENNSW